MPNHEDPFLRLNSVQGTLVDLDGSVHTRVDLKPMGDPFILESKTVSALECLRYSLSLPVRVVSTGIDSMERLDQALKAAREFKPLSEKDVSALLAKTEKAAKDGKYERYKTSHHFDGTFQNPQWLGPGPAPEPPTR